MRRYRESKMMSRMRFLPQLITTLEKEIQKDKETLADIHIHMGDGKKTDRIKNKEKLIHARIERNRVALQRLRTEKANIRERLDDMIII